MSQDLVLGMHHPALVVADLEAALEFYIAFAGYEVVVRNSWDETSSFNEIIGLRDSRAQFAVLKNRAGFLELFEFETPKSEQVPGTLKANELGIRHLCFQVTNVPEALAYLVSLGGQKVGEPIKNERGVTSVYARDPFGHLIELLDPGAHLPGIDDA